MDTAIKDHQLTVAGQGVYGGSSFWMQAPKGVNTEELAIQLKEQSVLIEPGRPFFENDHAPPNYFRLAYSSIAAEKIGPGVEIIANAIARR